MSLRSRAISPPHAASTANSNLRPEGTDDSIKTRVMMDALKMELQFYRNFFWSHQQSLRRNVVPLTTADEEEGSATRSKQEEDPLAVQQEDMTAIGLPSGQFALGYQLQLAQAQCRSADDEAVTLHEHYRHRIDALEKKVMEEQTRNGELHRQNAHVREANHALCQELCRMQRRAHELQRVHMNRMHQIFLILSETLWRARIEAEALQYLVLRAADSVLAGASPSSSETGQSFSSSATQVRANNSRHIRMCTAVSQVFDTYFKATRLGSTDWSPVLQCETEYLFVASEAQARVAELCESTEGRQRRLQREDDFTKLIHTNQGGDDKEDGRPFRLAGKHRSGLTSHDEELICMCLEEHRISASTDTEGGRRTALLPSNNEGNDEDNDEVNSATVAAAATATIRGGGGALQLQEEEEEVNKRKRIAEYERATTVGGKEYDDARAVVPVHSGKEQSALGVSCNRAAQEHFASPTEASQQLSTSLVDSFYHGHHAVVPAPSYDTHQYPEVLDALVHRAAGRQESGRWLPENVDRSAQILDPVVAANQKLRSEVLALRRELTEANSKSVTLEAKLRNAQRASVQTKSKAIQLLSHGLGHNKSTSDLVDGEGSKNGNTAVGGGGVVPSEHVVRRMSAAADDMKAYERIARMSPDPSLRGKMLRQMKDLHREVSLLLDHGK